VSELLECSDSELSVKDLIIFLGSLGEWGGLSISSNSGSIEFKSRLSFVFETNSLGTSPFLEVLTLITTCVSTSSVDRGDSVAVFSSFPGLRSWGWEFDFALSFGESLAELLNLPFATLFDII
jgi:hypothetical protein